MTNSIEEAYVAPRSLETLKRLRELSVDSVSVMPLGFVRDAKADRIVFIQRNPQGETDEGVLRAVADARSLGMSAMVKPQLWVGAGASAGDIAHGGRQERGTPGSTRTAGSSCTMPSWPRPRAPRSFASEPSSRRPRSTRTTG